METIRVMKCSNGIVTKTGKKLINAENARTINKAVKDLLKLDKEISKTPVDYNKLVDQLKDEFVKIYRMDSKFELMSKESVLIMLRLNLSIEQYNFIPLVF